MQIAGWWCGRKGRGKGDDAETKTSCDAKKMLRAGDDKSRVMKEEQSLEEIDGDRW